MTTREAITMMYNFGFEWDEVTIYELTDSSVAFGFCEWTEAVEDFLLHLTVNCNYCFDSDVFNTAYEKSFKFNGLKTIVMIDENLEEDFDDYEGEDF